MRICTGSGKVLPILELRGDQLSDHNVIGRDIAEPAPKNYDLNAYLDDLHH